MTRFALTVALAATSLSASFPLYEGNPVLAKDKDWEGWRPCGGSTVKDGQKSPQNHAGG